MSHIFDASCLLNLAHGEILDTILDLTEISARVGPIVASECISIKSIVDAAIDAGKIILLDEDAISADRFISLLDKYNLGPGETECIAFAMETIDTVCLDDSKARKIAAQKIGSERVIGTLGLLRATVDSGRLTTDGADNAYIKMLARGAFLPPFNKTLFT